jgi:phage recombination protein Bet
MRWKHAGSRNEARERDTVPLDLRHLLPAGGFDDVDLGRMDLMSETSIATQSGYQQHQIDLIRKQVAPAGTTNDELALFLAYAERTGLDPFSRQIYLSERRANVNGQWVVSRKPEVTIDGFRLVAERTGKYAGQVGPEWCGQDGAWVDVWLADGPPSAARIGVLRHDFTAPVYSVALYREYCQMKSDGQPNSMWKKYPSVMLAKCAESLALRRAFPRELSGLYTREEMPEEREDGKKAGELASERRHTQQRRDERWVVQEQHLPVSHVLNLLALLVQKYTY